MLYALACFIQWGLYPLYWKQMKHFPSFETLGHRVIFACLLLALFFLLTKRKFPLNKKTLSFGVLISSVLILANWFTFIWAVNNSLIVEAGIGYYLSPVISVLMGTFFLKEKLSKIKKLGVFFVLCSLFFLFKTKIGAPWVSLTLALSFGLYGLARKRLSLGALEALWIETAFASVFMALYFIYLGVNSEIVGFNGEAQNLLLVIGAGLITLTPLICYGKAVKTLELSTLGVLQYLAPTIQLFVGVAIYNEKIDTNKQYAIALIVISILIFIFDNYKIRNTLRKND